MSKLTSLQTTTEDDVPLEPNHADSRVAASDLVLLVRQQDLLEGRHARRVGIVALLDKLTRPIGGKKGMKKKRNKKKKGKRGR